MASGRHMGGTGDAVPAQGQESSRARPRGRSARILRGTLAGAFLGAVLTGFGLVGPEQAASALVAPAPLPVSLSSELAALVAEGGFTAAEGAAAAGATGTVAFPPALTAGVVGAGAFLATAQGLGAIMRVTGTDPGMCSAGALLGSLYGADCTGSLQVTPFTEPNADRPADYLTANYCGTDGACIRIIGTEKANVGNPRWTIIDLEVTGATPLNNPGDTYYRSAAGNPVGITHAYPCGGGWCQSQVAARGRADYQSLGWLNAGGPAVVSATDYPADLNTLRCLKPGSPTAEQEAAFGQCMTNGGNMLQTVRPDPARYFESDATGPNGQHYKCQSAQFHESDATVPQWCSPTIPAVGAAVHLVVREWLADGSSSRVVYEVDASDAYKDALESYPDCGKGACQLRVQYKGKDCTIGQSACVDWMTKAEQTPADYRCEYGPHEVALSECVVLARYYDPAAQAAGKAYSNPKNGSDPGGQTSGKSDGDPAGDGGTDEGGEDCLGNAVTANPVTWVTGPVECALQWAFVPSPEALQTDVEAMKSSWDGTPQGKLVGVMQSWDFEPPSSGCGGLTVPLDFLHQVGVHVAPLAVGAACPGQPLAAWAGFAKLFFQLAVVVTGVLSIIRSVQGIIAYQGGSA